jgi:hypothetical protein
MLLLLCMHGIQSGMHHANGTALFYLSHYVHTPAGVSKNSWLSSLKSVYISLSTSSRLLTIQIEERLTQMHVNQSSIPQYSKLKAGVAESLQTCNSPLECIIAILTAVAYGANFGEIFTYIAFNRQEQRTSKIRTMYSAVFSKLH